MEIVGSVIFKDKTLPIYSSLDVPLFRARPYLPSFDCFGTHF